MRAPWAGRAPALTLLTGLGLLLGACAAEPLPDGTVVIAAVPTYCYRTLADPECVPRPEPGAAGRFIAAGIGARTFIVEDGELQPLP